MKKERNNKQTRKMKPVFLVFCEGETEETYVNFLRKEYRLPIKVIPRITGLSLSPAILQRYIKAEKIGPSDKITSFLMYDLDLDVIAKKLASLKDYINIASNPIIELWFMLHSAEQNVSISTDSCLEKLMKSAAEWGNYKKGTLSDNQKQLLWNNRKTAADRAKRLKEGENPSSMVYRLIEKMEEYYRK